MFLDLSLPIFQPLMRVWIIDFLLRKHNSRPNEWNTIYSSFPSENGAFEIELTIIQMCLLPSCRISQLSMYLVRISRAGSKLKMFSVLKCYDTLWACSVLLFVVLYLEVKLVRRHEMHKSTGKCNWRTPEVTPHLIYCLFA